jgi:hypothetical protein
MAKTATTAPAGMEPAQLLQFGKERADAMFHAQQEMFNAYQEAGRAWAHRLKSEVELWSDLAAKVTASRSMPEGLRAYQDSISRRVLKIASVCWRIARK